MSMFTETVKRSRPFGNSRHKILQLKVFALLSQLSYFRNQSCIVSLFVLLKLLNSILDHPDHKLIVINRPTDIKNRITRPIPFSRKAV